jgi:hypothetical protein
MQDHQSERYLTDHDLRISLRRELVAIYPEYGGARSELIRELLEVQRYRDAVTELTAYQPLLQGAHSKTVAEFFYLMGRAKAGLGDLTGAQAAAGEMRRVAPAVPTQYLQAILEEWRKTHPEVDDAAFHRTLREWKQSP